MFSLLPVTIWLEAVTGERWSERVRLFETVGELKRRVWRRKQIPPSRQALVFCGRALPDAMELDSIGVRADSVLKLVVMTRSGPHGMDPSDEMQHTLSDDPSDREHRRCPWGFSAPEDTSAKESSAGETEREGGDADCETTGPQLARLSETAAANWGRHPRRNRTNSQTVATMKVADSVAPSEADGGVGALESAVAGCSGTGGGTLSDELDEEDEVDEEKNGTLAARTSPPPADVEDAISEEDTSEVSSGMIVCNLTNEFRKLKVRRHRHLAPPSSSRQRTRSKPRGANGGGVREASSSEDNEAGTDLPPVAIPLPSRRGLPTRGLRPLGIRSANGVARCSTCAFRISNPFFCRCGKTLCSRHRAAQAHTCAKLRHKLQQVSD